MIAAKVEELMRLVACAPAPLKANPFCPKATETDAAAAIAEMFEVSSAFTVTSVALAVTSAFLLIVAEVVPVKTFDASPTPMASETAFDPIAADTAAAAVSDETLLLLTALTSTDCPDTPLLSLNLPSIEAMVWVAMILVFSAPVPDRATPRLPPAMATAAAKVSARMACKFDARTLILPAEDAALLVSMAALTRLPVRVLPMVFFAIAIPTESAPPSRPTPMDKEADKIEAAIPA